MTETGGQPSRFFSDKGCRRAPLLLRRLTRRGITLPVVSVPRPAGTGRALLPLPAGVGESVRQPVALY